MNSDLSPSTIVDDLREMQKVVEGQNVLPRADLIPLKRMVNALVDAAPSMDRMAPNLPVKDSKGQPYAYDKNGTIHRLFEKPKSRKRERAAR